MKAANMLERTPRITRVTKSPKEDANGVAILSIKSRERRRTNVWSASENAPEKLVRTNQG